MTPGSNYLYKAAPNHFVPTLVIPSSFGDHILVAFEEGKDFLRGRDALSFEQAFRSNARLGCEFLAFSKVTGTMRTRLGKGVESVRYERGALYLLFLCSSGLFTFKELGEGLILHEEFVLARTF
ncbi:MAG TPA: hypothetical protein DCR97_08525 [Deltaproteobacteria bacterium]|nr:hypothetical protein [Deltaproteobacteria bacterium]